jgi:hypothetical protein
MTRSATSRLRLKPRRDRAPRHSLERLVGKWTYHHSDSWAALDPALDFRPSTLDQFPASARRLLTLYQTKPRLSPHLSMENHRATECSQRKAQPRRDKGSRLQPRRDPGVGRRVGLAHVCVCLISIPICIKANADSRIIHWPDLNVQPIPHRRTATVGLRRLSRAPGRAKLILRIAWNEGRKARLDPEL